MFALPRFFSLPFALPSLPSISLPANIQRRFLSYILKRALGRFFRSGLDVDKIQAQISGGWVEVEGLEVDEEEINSLIPPSIPLTLTSGSLSKVTAKVPFPNWSDPLALTLDTLTLDFFIQSPSTRSKAPDLSSRSHNPPSSRQPVDLASSVASVADDFLHDEVDAYEEAELDRSIRQSLILTQTDPFTNDDVPGAFPSNPPSAAGTTASSSSTVEGTTVLAGLVERILAKLEFQVKDVTVRIHHEDKRHGGVLELRIGQIRYADETGDQQVNEPRYTVRTIKLSSMGLYMLPNIDAGRRPGLAPSRSSSVSSASSSSSSTSNGAAEMMMSLAVADLRQSATSEADTDASVYHSAYSEAPEQSSLGKRTNDQAMRGRTPSPAPTITESKPRQGTMLLGFGSEDITFKVTTTQARQTASTAKPSGTPADIRRPMPAQAPSAPKCSPLPSLSMEIVVGTVAVVLLPSQLGMLLSVAQTMTSFSEDQTSTTIDHASDTAQGRLEARLRIKGVFVSTIYDMAAETSAELATALPSYWAKPATTYLPVGHLKLRLESFESTYSFEGVSPRPGMLRTATERSIPSRGSARQPPAVLFVKVSDLSIFEYLASDTTPLSGEAADAPPGGAYPLLIFDNGLPKQYDASPSAPTFASSRATWQAQLPVFPEFDAFDWRNSGLQKKTGGGERAWKVRQKARGAMKGMQGPEEQDTGPVIVSRKELSVSSPASVELQPVHVFLDLSLVERLLPMLRYITPIIKSPQSNPDLTPHPSPSRSIYTNLPPDPTGQFVIDDLDAQANSFATIQPSTQRVESSIVRCPLLRIDIRCPAPPGRRGTWGDDAHLRSGIVTLDIHGLAAHLGRSLGSTTGAARPTRESTESGSTANVEWRRMILFFCRVPDKKASAFLVVGPLSPEANEVAEDEVLLPVVEHKTVYTAHFFSSVKTQVVTCKIPSLQAKIRQRTIEGLQFFADDITHWLDGAFRDGSAPKPRDELKMIGSRFFGGSKGSSSSSSAAEDEEDEATSAALLRVVISEVDIALHVPRHDVDGQERVLSLKASDVDAKVETNPSGRQETVFSLGFMDADFSDRTNAACPSRIFGRTTPLSLSNHNQPLIHLRFSSLTNAATETKETGIKLVCSCFTLFVNKDHEWVQELALFAKTPEGVFEDVVPSEVTRINLQLDDCSVHVSAPSLPGAVVLVVGALDLKTNLESYADENTFDISLSSTYVLALDDLSVATALALGHYRSVEAWNKAGYAILVDVNALDVQLYRDLTLSKEVLVDILRSQIRITACADSLATLSVIAGDLGNLRPQKSTATESVRSPASLEQSINVFASIDEDAFTQIPEIVSGADLIEDDLPTNLDYLDTANRPQQRLSTDRSTGESLRSWQTTDEHDGFASEVNGETVRILMDEAFEMERDYWDNLPVLSGGFGDDTRIGQYRVRLHDCSLGIFLYDGYDWIKTRKVIEEEIKAIRRRLEKIRQLLASGQKPDASIERPSSLLFNSVYIGLDQDRENLDSAALIAAIDEELQDLADETATQSSWQSFPTRVGLDRPPAKKPHLRGKRLTRSKKPQIEVSLAGVKADLDMYGSDSETASRLQVMVKSMEILDHIKTSTWKKFLTEMKADSRGNIRETDADMVRLELSNVRPSLPSLEEESRLRLKILPLRLHIDQDALDFLKRFFSFQAPSPPSADPAPTSKKPSSEPFFQHVEIFPIELKLDYKPKRVDFTALREGKTIELMNFFHFDGAEMTLRHITISGITGVARLSTALQDIWTPDVKANQLADVISGVSPIRSMVNVGSGVADLILLPIEQYRKDGRLARGVQRGTNSFVKSTALEMMKLGARLATGTQVILEKAEGVLGGKFGENVIGEVEGGANLPGSTAAEARGSQYIATMGDRDEFGKDDDEDDDRPESSSRRAEVSRYANQPSDMKEGVQAAYKSLSRNINSAAQTILAVPMEVYERSGDDGPLRAVVRAVPIAVLKPMIGASEAVSKTLLGMRNSLDPQGREELVDKYK